MTIAILIFWLESNKNINPGEFKFIGLGCDVSSEPDVQNVFAEVMKTFGKVDAVVASAGMYLILCKWCVVTIDRSTTRHRGELFGLWVSTFYNNFAPQLLNLSSYPTDRIKLLFDINVHGAFFTAREAARYMVPQGGGSIILIASMSANVRTDSDIDSNRSAHRKL